MSDEEDFEIQTHKEAAEKMLSYWSIQFIKRGRANLCVDIFYIKGREKKNRMINLDLFDRISKV